MRLLKKSSKNDGFFAISNKAKMMIDKHLDMLF